jgi:hypothetical protein
MINGDSPDRRLQLASDFIQFTNQHVFLTGKAGTGKTTFLHHLKKQPPKRMVVVAPTGVAAINAGGVTIHSFFQLPFGPILTGAATGGGERAGAAPREAGGRVFRFNREKVRIIQSLDLLVIDEVSMVRADLLDGIDEVLRRFRHSGRPFGGVQLLLIGDLQQLAPVVKGDEWQLLQPYYDTPYFFSSRALREAPPVCIELTTVYRQSDRRFIDLLNRVRNNELDDRSLAELNRRHLPGFAAPEDDSYITLTTHNARAQQINETRLDKLPGQPSRFKAAIEGEFPEYAYPAEAELALKTGAQVMFVKNDNSLEKRFFNGKIGRVERLSRDTAVVQCPGDAFEITVEAMEWTNARYAIDEETKEIKEEVVGTFRQLPLKLAWAITIHKSQGLTFDKAVIDARAAFAPGQVYVALSRCRSLDGLVLGTPIARRGIQTDPHLRQFNREVEQNPPDAARLAEARIAYQHELLGELFDFSTLQKRLAYCARLWREHAASLAGNPLPVLETAREEVGREIAEVNERFLNQLQPIIREEPDLETNERLQERVRKACAYYLDKLDACVRTPLTGLDVATDNKAVRKALQDVLDRLHQELRRKTAGLQACRSGFLVREYSAARTRAALEEGGPPSRKADGGREAAASADPALYEALAAWRKEKAAKVGQPAHRLLTRKTMLELVRVQPASPAELRRIKGIGPATVKKSGTEILKIILSTGSRPHAEPDDAPRPPEKPPKPDTKQITYDRWKAGRTVAEIAAERGLAVSTIEHHLAYFVGTGEIGIGDLVAPDKVEWIIAYFREAGNRRVGPAKAALGNRVTYGELQLVAAHLAFRQRRNPGGEDGPS